MRTPTIVVVKAEFTIVHQNIVKFRMMPIINDRTRIRRNVNEYACHVGKTSNYLNKLIIHRHRRLFVPNWIIEADAISAKLS